MLKKSAKSVKSKTAKKQSKPLPPVVLWAVVDNEFPDDPVTFTATRQEALIALDQYLYLKHYKHFRLWCPLHGYEVDHGEAWATYSKTISQTEYNGSPLYTIVQIDYEPNVIASLLRTYHGCVPMGCPFDTDEELGEFSAYLADKSEKVEKGEAQFTPIEEALNVLFEDLEEQNCAACDEKHCPSNPNFKDDGSTTTTHKDKEGGCHYDA